MHASYETFLGNLEKRSLEYHQPRYFVLRTYQYFVSCIKIKRLASSILHPNIAWISDNTDNALETSPGLASYGGLVVAGRGLSVMVDASDTQ